ncbi:FecR family protein [Parapedobacter indicus]|uniref:FecR family protein n=1 Tax=Parapedobacter indicus TaxID=1477437 RepID=A0A1I3INA3_9SPHI|nr:FecR domain-containing protein [Parapedobacter indicus]PPL02235.1 FecR family protein [Parapedobacter indicus]SFI49458.1 FecR family protein [Parapedobacter indicus]
MDKEVFLQLLSRKLSGSLPPEEERKLGEILDTHTDYKRQAEVLELYFQTKRRPTMAHRIKLAGLWEAIEAEESEASQKVVHESADQEASPDRISKRGSWLRLAAMILFCLGMGITLYWYFQTPAEPAFAEIKTEADRQFITLADGTFIVLDPSSTLRYNADFGKHDRAIKLDGEAYFEVAKNNALPLVVHAGQLQVRVVGTTFQVRAYEDAPSATVALLEGVVEVSGIPDRTKGQTSAVRLYPMQQLEVRQNQTQAALTSFSKDSLLNELGWWPTADSLTFHVETLGAVLRRISKKFKVQFIVRPKKLNDVRFTGAFSDDTSLENVLKVLQAAYPFTYRFETENRIVIE